MDLAALQSALDVALGSDDPEPVRALLRAEGWKPPAEPPRASQDEILARVRVDPETGCWVWTKKLTDGYGKLRGRAAHRMAWEAFVGPIPDGFHVDHVCRNRACVRPDLAHLEPVTKAENNRRAMAYVQQYPGEQVHHAAKQWCKRGHRFNETNTGVDRLGKRYCKACRHDCLRQWRARKKLAAAS